jgi:glycosyltransferase involved in cell wall biosynthesis
MVPTVSIVMSTFNGERHLQEAIASLLCQSYADFELIVVNDGSTDTTPIILDSIADPRLIVLTNESNMGIACSQNRAMEKARGEFVALQDHDDVSHAERLASQVEFLECHPDIDAVGSSCLIIDDHGQVKGQWELPAADLDIKWRLLFRYSFLHTTLMIRRSAIERIGGYNESPQFQFSEDYELLSRMAAEHRVANLREPLVSWRQHSGQASNRNQSHQDESADRTALRNAKALMGDQEVDEGAWATVKLLLMNAPDSPVTLSSSQVRVACRLMKKLQREFYERYSVPAAEQAKHRKEIAWLWGKHLLALSYRGNGKRGPACRASLFFNGINILKDAMSAHLIA